jgi:hypothetical protein
MDNNMIFRTLLIIVAAFVLFALVNFYNNKQTSVKAEKFYQDNFSSELLGDFQPKQPSAPVAKPAPASVSEVNTIAPSEPLGNEDYRAIDFQSNKLPNDCFPKDRLTADDLLPKDAANSKWAQVNPAGQGDVKDQNFLTAGYMLGINTVGSSLKNANLQLRSEPVIPKVSVGPFLNSSYEASDALRRPLEGGGDC